MLLKAQLVHEVLNMGSSKVEDISAPEDLANSLRILLIAGRIIGVVPYGGVTTGKVEELKFRFRTFGALMNIFISFFMTLNIFVGTSGFFTLNDRSAQGMATNAQYALLYSAALCNYLFFLLKAEDFLRILREWKCMKFHFMPEDRNLRRDINLIVVFIYTSIILENITWHVKHGIAVGNDLNKNSNMTNSTAFERFYFRSAPIVATVLPYHPAIMGCIFITNKLCLYAREFGDIFIIVVSRAIYFKFKHLVQEANDKLCCIGSIESDPKRWKELILDFRTLSNILTVFANFLSPLVFLSFSLNIYYISLRLCLTLQIRDESWAFIDGLYANWAFFHGITRCYLVTLSAAKINEYALSIRHLLAKCPQEIYSPEIERFENQLNNSDIGLHGFGCFTATKSFLLKLVGVVFTVEIVLLQSTSPSKAVPNCN